MDTAQGLQCKTITICTQVLSHKSPNIRSRAARTIFDLTMPYKGKETACESECILVLVELLEDGESSVRSQAAAALMRSVCMSAALMKSVCLFVCMSATLMKSVCLYDMTVYVVCHSKCISNFCHCLSYLVCHLVYTLNPAVYQ